ncbi:hypothetical protein BC833DRAFT_619918 [Globomyces pollinis-pini]|nr:hypothetical protein BC833DRAFT_619918 [Globomyces pollinis-pini]
MGSLVVGFVIRLLPEFPIPRYLLPGSEREIAYEPVLLPKENEKLIVDSDAKEKILEAVKLDIKGISDDTMARMRWNEAIHKTRTQIRVAKTFADSKGLYSGTRVAVTETATTSNDATTNEHWHKLRLYVQSASMFRRRGDPSSSQLRNPRAVRSALIIAAYDRKGS